MKKAFIVTALILLVLLAGCAQRIEIKVEPKDEQEEVIEEPACNEDGNCDVTEDCECVDCKNTFDCRKKVLGKDEYLLKKGTSEKIAEKTLTFVNLDSEGKTEISIDGTTATIDTTKTREIINKMEVTVLETEYSTSPEKTIVKLLVKAYQPGPNEYLFEKSGSEMIIESVRISLKYVEKSTPNNFVKIDVGKALNQKVKEGEIRVIEGLSVTALEVHPKGTPSKSYAILKVEKA